MSKVSFGNYMTALWTEDSEVTQYKDSTLLGVYIATRPLEVLLPWRDISRDIQQTLILPSICFSIHVSLIDYTSLVPSDFTKNIFDVIILIIS